MQLVYWIYTPRVRPDHRVFFFFLPHLKLALISPSSQRCVVEFKGSSRKGYLTPLTLASDPLQLNVSAL